MFNFLRRLATPHLHQQLSIREQAIQVFSDIEGLDDIKEMIGPPACAKSLFMLEMERIMSSKRVYFAEGASTTKAGIQKFIGENQHKEIIIIDEIDKMPIKDQEGLLTMMERGDLPAPR
jgi:replication-associated recombination protein RarA